MAFDIGELRGVISLNDTFSPGINKVAKELGFASESFKAITGLAGLSIAAITGATAAVVALGVRGAAVNDVRGAFDNLTTAAGSSADVMLGALQRGTLGTISDFDLMSKANGVLGSGMVKTAGEMETLAAGAKLLADRTGGDTATAFDTLTGAMASGRVATLKQMGVFVDTKVAIQEYANALGISREKLTKEQEAEAISTATLAALRGQLAAVAPATADFGDQIDRGKVAVQNFTDNLAVAVATSPVVAAGMDAISKGVSAAFGGNQQEMVKTLQGLVGDFAIFLMNAAGVAVRGAEAMVVGFTLVKVGLNVVLEAVAGAVATYTNFLATILEKTASLPIVGDKYKALATDMRSISDAASAQAIGFGELAQKGMTSADSQKAAFATVKAAISETTAAMEAASAGAGTFTEKASLVSPPLAAIGAAATLTAAQIKAMEDQTNLSLGLMAESATNAANLEMTLQQQLAVLRTSGVQQRLLELDFARQAEIAGIQNLAFEEQEIYAARVADITEKYALMASIATGANLTIAQRAKDAGIQTRAALQETADKARELWADMVGSGTSAAEDIKKAWEAAEEAKRAATGATTTFTVGSVGEMLTAVGGLMQAAGLSFKRMMLAGAIISGISAIQKALAAPPGWPFNAAAVVTVGIAQAVNVAKIASSSPGFAMGTPGTRFQDFGRLTTVDLHGREAIVTPRQGASLAGMVEDSLDTRDTRTLDELRGLREDMAADRRLLKINLRDAVLIGMANA